MIAVNRSGVAASRVLANADPNDLTRFQGFERAEHVRHENQQIIEVRGAGSNNQQRDGTTAQALLIRFFEGLVLGTTTLRAVRHAPCPVLTVSGPGEVR